MYAKEITYVKHWTIVYISTKSSTDEVLKAQYVVIQMGQYQCDPCY